MNTLFGNKVISSISFSQDEILRDIYNLYLPDGLHVDCTYSTGNFYVNLPKPELKFDINPQAPGVIKAASFDLPMEPKSVKSLMFDPPFIASWNVKSKDYLMTSRFSNIKGMSNLRKMYSNSLIEFGRVIKSQGILVVKCQDTMYAGEQYFNHIYIYNEALKSGFDALDLFVLMSKNRFMGSGTQRSSRKFHAYFWVFKKVRCRRTKKNV